MGLLIFPPSPVSIKAVAATTTGKMSYRQQREDELMRRNIHEKVSQFPVKHDKPMAIVLSEEDLAMFEKHRNSTPFQPSQSKTGCVLIRASLDTLEQGRTSLEALFHKYHKTTVPEGGTPKLDTFSEIIPGIDINLLEAFMTAEGITEEEAIRRAVNYGLRLLSLLDWQERGVGSDREAAARLVG